MKVWRNTIIEEPQSNQQQQQPINWDSTKIIKMEYDFFDKSVDILTGVGTHASGGSFLGRVCEDNYENEILSRSQAGTLNDVYVHSLNNYSKIGIKRLYNCKKSITDTAWTDVIDYDTRNAVSMSNTKEVYFYNFYFLSKVNNPNLALLNYYLDLINPYELEGPEEDTDITQHHLLGYRGAITSNSQNVDTLKDYYIGSTSDLYDITTIGHVAGSRTWQLYYYNLGYLLTGINQPYYRSSRQNITVFDSQFDTEFTHTDYISKPKCAILDVDMMQTTFVDYTYCFLVCLPKQIQERTIF